MSTAGRSTPSPDGAAAGKRQAAAGSRDRRHAMRRRHASHRASRHGGSGSSAQLPVKSAGTNWIHVNPLTHTHTHELEPLLLPHGNHTPHTLQRTGEEGMATSTRSVAPGLGARASGRAGTRRNVRTLSLHTSARCSARSVDGWSGSRENTCGESTRLTMSLAAVSTCARNLTNRTKVLSSHFLTVVFFFLAQLYRKFSLLKPGITNRTKALSSHFQ
eukprot:COSAG01_NODE_2369_length_7814_cov_22.805185_4_plen_217_part_00